MGKSHICLFYGLILAISITEVEIREIPKPSTSRRKIVYAPTPKYVQSVKDLKQLLNKHDLSFSGKNIDLFDVGLLKVLHTAMSELQQVWRLKFGRSGHLK